MKAEVKELRRINLNFIGFSSTVNFWLINIFATIMMIGIMIKEYVYPTTFLSMIAILLLITLVIINSFNYFFIGQKLTRKWNEWQLE